MKVRPNELGIVAWSQGGVEVENGFQGEAVPVCGRNSRGRAERRKKESGKKESVHTGSIDWVSDFVSTTSLLLLGDASVFAEAVTGYAA